MWKLKTPKEKDVAVFSLDVVCSWMGRIQTLDLEPIFALIPVLEPVGST